VDFVLGAEGMFLVNDDVTDYVEIHSAEEIAAEVERMKLSPEMFWWLSLLNGYWNMEGQRGDSILRTEAYNRLTMMKLGL
jgi:hypothetical protein